MTDNFNENNPLDPTDPLLDKVFDLTDEQIQQFLNNVFNDEDDSLKYAPLQILMSDHRPLRVESNMLLNEFNVGLAEPVLQCTDPTHDHDDDDRDTEPKLVASVVIESLFAPEPGEEPDVPVNMALLFTNIQVMYSTIFSTMSALLDNEGLQAVRKVFNEQAERMRDTDATPFLFEEYHKLNGGTPSE